MSTPGSKSTAIGFTFMLLSVSAGIHIGGGGFGLLLCFMGVLVSANLVAVGVRMADHPAPFPAAFVRRNTAAVRLVIVMASCDFMVVSGEAEPVLCFAMFTLLLLGVSLISVGARGE